MGREANLATIAALIRRARNELLRVPGAAIPGILAPTIFFLGLTSVFGHLQRLELLLPLPGTVRRAGARKPGSAPAGAGRHGR